MYRTPTESAETTAELRDRLESVRVAVLTEFQSEAPNVIFIAAAAEEIGRIEETLRCIEIDLAWFSSMHSTLDTLNQVERSLDD